MAPKPTIHEEYFYCLWGLLSQGISGVSRNSAMEKKNITRITVNRESPTSKRGCLVGNSRVVRVVSSPSRRWPTTAYSILFLHKQEILLRVGVYWRTIMDISFKWILSKWMWSFVKGVTQTAADKRPRLPHVRGWCGRRALTSRNAPHSTRAPLVRSCGILILQRSVLPSVNGIGI